MKEKIIRSYNLFGIVILVIAILIWMAPFKKDAFSLSDKKNISVVKLAEVQKIESCQVVTYSGVTRSEERASLAFTMPGRLVSRPVEVGENVNKGQVIARIDDREFRNAVNMADASVNELSARVLQAERTLKRLNRLFKTGAASPEEMEQAETGVATLKAALASAGTRLGEARRILGESTISAPFAGTVTEVFTEPGEWTGPGAPVILLAGDGPVELKVEVPENTVTRLIKNQHVKVSLPYAEGRFVNGTIKYLARAASGEGRLFPVVISLEQDEQLFPGMTAELIIDIKAEDSIGVPVKSILNPGSSNPYIFCYRNGIVEKIPVTLGALKGQKVIVNGNVSAGDLVVVAGHTMLSDGDRVEAHNE